jgi:hypothetical protein
MNLTASTRHSTAVRYSTTVPTVRYLYQKHPPLELREDVPVAVHDGREKGKRHGMEVTSIMPLGYDARRLLVFRRWPNVYCTYILLVGSRSAMLRYRMGRYKSLHVD